jgi:hypothetical protein
MKKMVLVLVSLFTMNAAAMDLNYGVLGGVNQVEVDSGVDSMGSTGKTNFRFGGLVNWNIDETMSLRTGVLYASRYVSLYSTMTSARLLYKYVDVPLLFQYNINSKLGFYAGAVASMNVDDKTEATLGPAVSSDAKFFYPQAQVGLAFKTENNIGFEVFFEQGFGDITSGSLKDFRTYGANFVWWM